MVSDEGEEDVRIPETLLRDLPQIDFLRWWQLGITKQGFFGLVPQPTTAGDVVSVLYGANVPVILRPAEGHDPPEYRFIGPACIHGIMQGQVLEVLDQIDVQPELVRLL